jgi:hypothetical protein
MCRVEKGQVDMGASCNLAEISAFHCNSSAKMQVTSISSWAFSTLNIPYLWAKFGLEDSLTLRRFFRENYSLFHNIREESFYILYSVTFFNVFTAESGYADEVCSMVQCFSGFILRIICTI